MMKWGVALLVLCVTSPVLAGRRAPRRAAAAVAQVEWQQLREVPGLAGGGAFTTWAGAPVTARTARYLLGRDRAAHRFFIGDAGTRRILAEISRPALGGLYSYRRDGREVPVLSVTDALASFFAEVGAAAGPRGGK